MNIQKKSTSEEGVKLSPKQIIKGLKINLQLVDEQKEVSKSCYENDYTFIIGDIASGKTFVAVHNALTQLQKGFVERIWISRPIVPNNLGILPGAQPYSSKILTPKGWTTMGEIQEGDEVYTPEGKIVKVLGTYEHGERDTFKVSTNYGRSTIACDKHLWEVQECNYRRKLNNPRLVDTTYIKDNLLNNEGFFRFKLPLNDAIPFSTVGLPISPYVLGVLLGDGSSIGNSISFSSVDEEVVDNVRESLGEGFFVNKVKNTITHTISTSNKNNKPAKTIMIKNNSTGEVKTYDRIGLALEDLDISRGSLNDRCERNVSIDGYTYSFIDDRDQYTNILKQQLLELGLLGKKHLDKFIPEIYKFSSVEQRLELLRGLLDTDGSINKNGEIIYHSTSKLLIDGVKEIVRSLGGRTYVTVRDRIGDSSTHISYDLGISFKEYPDLFKLTRKKNRLKKYTNIHKEFVSSVEFNGREKVKCILIDDTRHLYITDEYIVTHNTIDDKLEPYIYPIKHNVEMCVGADSCRKLFDSGLIQIMPIDTAKGVTFVDSFVIIDEVQDCNYDDLRTIMSRLGKSSKMALCGSRQQISRKIGKHSSMFVIDAMYNKHIEIKGTKLLNLTSNHRNKTLTHLLPLLDAEYEAIQDNLDAEKRKNNENQHKRQHLTD